MDYYDLLLAKKLADSGGSSIVVEELSVTENGTYNVETDIPVEEEEISKEEAQ